MVSFAKTSLSLLPELQNIREDALISGTGGCSDSLLEQLEIEVSEKIHQLRSLSERLLLRLENNFQCEVLKLPQVIRSMSMQEFCVQYGGDVDEALQQQAKRAKMAGGAARMPPPPPVARGRNRAAESATPAPSARGRRGAADTPAGANQSGRISRSRSKVMATPGNALACTPGQPMMTPRVGETPRIARAGEVALSANGSPINLLNTVKAVGKRGRQGPAVMLTLADGTELDLAEEQTRRGLVEDDDARGQAVDQLVSLQAQLARHLKALQQVEKDGFAAL